MEHEYPSKETTRGTMQVHAWYSEVVRSSSAPDKNYKVPGQNTHPLLFMRELCPTKYNYGRTFEFLAGNCQMSDCYQEHCSS